VWTKEDWNQLAEVIRGKDVTVLADEVYEQLVFDGRVHHSVLQHEELRAKSFALYSFGKSLHATGWKMGYCIAPPQLTNRFRQLHQYLAFSVNAPMQKALADYLTLPKSEAPATLLQRKRDYFLELMKETAFEISRPTAGAYFQTASYRGISDLPDEEFAEWVTREAGVATIPVSAFYSTAKDDRLIRFCFAKNESTLQKAVERLAELQVCK
jgi:methionine aminotransferase